MFVCVCLCVCVCVRVGSYFVAYIHSATNIQNSDIILDTHKMDKNGRNN